MAPLPLYSARPSRRTGGVPFWFPDPPAPGALEWPGSPLGLSNVITRTRGRTAVQDKTLDRDPTARDALAARAAAAGVHSIHGACVSCDGRGLLTIGPAGTGKSTSSYGLMVDRNTRFHSNDWAHVRYTYRHRYGGRVLPLAVRSSTGEEVRGLWVHRWIDTHPADGEAPVTARSLMDKEFVLLLRELDLEAALGCRLAAPDRTALRLALARLIASHDGRAMLDLGRILEPGRIFANPMEPLRLGSVFLLKRDFASDVVLHRLDLPAFMARLFLGDTPAGTREVAFNASRAVDDGAERACVAALEAEVRATGEALTMGLYPRFAERAGVPESLREEFELFRLLHRAVPCYDVNTVLERAPGVGSRPEAVEHTLRLIRGVTAGTPADVRLTLADYRAFLA